MTFKEAFELMKHGAKVKLLVGTVTGVGMTKNRRL